MLFRSILHPPALSSSSNLLRTFSFSPSLASRIRPGHPHQQTQPTSKQTSAAFLALTASTTAAPGGRVPNHNPSSSFKSTAGLPRAVEEHDGRGEHHHPSSLQHSPTSIFHPEAIASSSSSSSILAAKRSLLSLSPQYQPQIQPTSVLNLPSFTPPSPSSTPFPSLPIQSPPSWGLLDPQPTSVQDATLESLLLELNPADASSSPADYHSFLQRSLSAKADTVQASAELEMLYALRRQVALMVLAPTVDRKGARPSSPSSEEAEIGVVAARGRRSSSRSMLRQEEEMDGGEKVLQMDSVRRKRKKMMNKHKRQKRRKATRTERRKFGK